MKLYAVRVFIPFWMCFAVSGTAVGQPDGFYLLSNDPAALSVPADNGRSVRLGLAQTIGVERLDFYAMDNANSRFHLSIGVSPDSPTIDSQFALVVSGRAHLTGGGTEHGTVGFNISGAESAEQIARHFDTAIDYMRHPGHQLLVEFVPTQEEFRIGDEVRVKLRMTNVSTNPVSFHQGGRYRGSTRDNQFAFTAWLGSRQVPDIGSIMHMGGIGVRRELAPGEVFGDEVSLSLWFAFDRPGTYRVHGSYAMDFYDPESETFGRRIWSDYASADFSVRIVE